MNYITTGLDIARSGKLRRDKTRWDKERIRQRRTGHDSIE